MWSSAGDTATVCSEDSGAADDPEAVAADGSVLSDEEDVLNSEDEVYIQDTYSEVADCARPYCASPFRSSVPPAAIGLATRSLRRGCSAWSRAMMTR